MKNKFLFVLCISWLLSPLVVVGSCTFTIPNYDIENNDTNTLTGCGVLARKIKHFNISKKHKGDPELETSLQNDRSISRAALKVKYIKTDESPFVAEYLLNHPGGAVNS